MTQPTRRRLRLPDGEVDLVTGSVHRTGGTQPLTDRERLLLEELFTHERMGRDELAHRLGAKGSSRAVDTLVRRLRSKLEVEPSRPTVLLTVRGFGYRLHRVDQEDEAFPLPTWRRDLELSDGFVDLRAGMVLRSGARVALTEQELTLLKLLRDRLCQVVPKAFLAREGLGQRVSTQRSRALDRALHRLRVKLEADPTRPRHLLTVARRGVRLEVDAPKTNLVPAPHPLFGRELHLERAFERVTRHRLCTLVGMAGVGKSRLAEAVAARWLATQGQAWFCALQAATTPSSAQAIVAHTLGVSPDDLTDRLQDDTLLLVLDNCEQIHDASQWVVALSEASTVHILCTSRSPLGTTAERVLRLQPLPSDPSVALYEAMCDQPLPLEHHAALMSLTGGLPLAVVLAAHRAPVSLPSELSHHLDSPLDLTSRNMDTPEHQRSLLRAFERSWNPLPDALRAALSAWSYAGGPLTVSQAAVLAEQSPQRTLDILHTLVDLSLVQTQRGSHSRFTFFPAFRDYVRRRQPADESVRTRWHRWVRDLVAPTGLQTLFRTRSAGLGGSLAEDAPHFHTLLHAPEADVVSAASTALVLIALERGPYEQTARWLDRHRPEDPTPFLDALTAHLWNRAGRHPNPHVQRAIDRAPTPGARAFALLAAAERARSRGHPEQATELAAEAMDLAPAKSWQKVMACETAARLHVHAGQPGNAVRCAQIGIQHLPPDGDVGVAVKAVLAGALAHANRLEEADLAFREALHAAESTEAHVFRCNLYTNLAWLKARYPEPDFDEILSLMRRGVALAERIGRGLAISPQLGEAIVLIELERFEEAGHCLAKAIQSSEQLGLGVLQGVGLGCLAVVRSHQDAQAALRLFKRGADLLEAAGDRPQLAQLWVRRGQVEHRLGRMEAAQASLRQARTIAKDLPPEGPTWDMIADLEGLVR